MYFAKKKKKFSETVIIESNSKWTDKYDLGDKRFVLSTTDLLLVSKDNIMWHVYQSRVCGMQLLKTIRWGPKDICTYLSLCIGIQIPWSGEK
jgi:hypothetical protein